jgi:antitoxin (DNA-binding transcriptional repressor) of toxin-antitoxin stability system
MKTYTIYEAKTHFSELVKRAASGETVLIGSHGNATVELRAAVNVAKPKSLFGFWEGQIVLPDGWDDPKVDVDITADVYAGIERDG